MLIASAALAFALLVQFSAPEGNPSYVGSATCASCHASRTSGSTFREWATGPHAGAGEALLSIPAQDYLRRTGESVDNCLRCHSTLGRAPKLPDEVRLAEEGIGCERCHGPGSEYSPSVVMRDAEAFRLAGGASGSLAGCVDCHRIPGRDPTLEACPVDTSQIEPSAGWQQIGHSREGEILPSEKVLEFTRTSDSTDE